MKATNLIGTLWICLLLVACAKSTLADNPSQIRPDFRPLVNGPISTDGFRAILGTGDLGIGLNRVGFVVTSEDGFVGDFPVTVSAYFFDQYSEWVLSQTAPAKFREWPYGNRGMYTTQLEFHSAGSWCLDISIGAFPETTQDVQLCFEVKEITQAPSVGIAAERSYNKTVSDVKNMHELATGSLHDRELYQLTIADAVTNGLPTVVVFASPAFCTNAVCGPQLEVLQQLKNVYKRKANFIHVDFYQNPEEIQGDLRRAVISPIVDQWKLPSTEWTFVIDRKGVVSARFEAFATFEEIEEALLREL